MGLKFRERHTVYECITHDIRSYYAQNHSTAHPLTVQKGYASPAQGNGMDAERRAQWLYYRIAEAAYADDIVTGDEAQILSIIARSLGLGPMDAMELLTAARSGDDLFAGEEAPEAKMEMGDATTYQGALIAALDDEVITEDEWAMLNLFRSLLGLQPEDHATIEEAIRSMADEDDNGERRLERLQQYLVAHPLE